MTAQVPEAEEQTTDKEEGNCWVLGLDDKDEPTVVMVVTTTTPLRGLATAWRQRRRQRQRWRYWQRRRQQRQLWFLGGTTTNSTRSFVRVFNPPQSTRAATSKNPFAIRPLQSFAITHRNGAKAVHEVGEELHGECGLERGRAVVARHRGGEDGDLVAVAVHNLHHALHVGLEHFFQKVGLSAKSGGESTGEGGTYMSGGHVRAIGSCKSKQGSSWRQLRELHHQPVTIRPPPPPATHMPHMSVW
jgi:hypothetical protein